mmetsp:Transcript_38266/g.123094  ORF Transcript_38266/g.123094 Transcript_38266/m.123094 type:complete len:86 (+) Transcript_38266:2529-2786(+)
MGNGRDLGCEQRCAGASIRLSTAFWSVDLASCIGAGGQHLFPSLVRLLFEISKSFCHPDRHCPQSAVLHSGQPDLDGFDSETSAA